MLGPARSGVDSAPACPAAPVAPMLVQIRASCRPAPTRTSGPGSPEGFRRAFAPDVSKVSPIDAAHHGALPAWLLLLIAASLITAA